jgi:hypothetical protein
MTPRPGRIADIIDVPLARPRNRRTLATPQSPRSVTGYESISSTQAVRWFCSMSEQSTLPISRALDREVAQRQSSIAARLRAQSDRIGMLVLVIAVLGVWQILVVVLRVSPLVMAKPSDITSALWTGFAEGLYWPHLATTLAEMITGFLIGSAAGFAFGLAITEFGRFGGCCFLISSPSSRFRKSQPHRSLSCGSDSGCSQRSYW